MLVALLLTWLSRATTLIGIAQESPAGTSLMPTGLLDGRSPDEVRDLLTFLMHEPLLRVRAELKCVREHGLFRDRSGGRRYDEPERNINAVGPAHAPAARGIAARTPAISDSMRGVACVNPSHAIPSVTLRTT